MPQPPAADPLPGPDADARARVADRRELLDVRQEPALRNTVIFGGVGMDAQKQALRSGMDILVATPGRLLDLMRAGLVDLRRSRCSSSTRRIACSTWDSSTTSRR
jgi:hypothetical protein